MTGWGEGRGGGSWVCGWRSVSDFGSEKQTQCLRKGQWLTELSQLHERAKNNKKARQGRWLSDVRTYMTGQQTKNASERAGEQEREWASKRQNAQASELSAQMSGESMCHQVFSKLTHKALQVSLHAWLYCLWHAWAFNIYAQCDWNWTLHRHTFQTVHTSPYVIMIIHLGFS